MYKTCFVVVMLSVSCMALPRMLRVKRSSWSTLKRAPTMESQHEQNMMYDLLMNEIYMHLGKSPNEGITAHDITNFFENVIGKDAHMAENFGTDYIFWGDQNGDHLLNREELKRAMKIHNVFQYI